MTGKKNLFKRNTSKIEDLDEDDYKRKIRNHRIRILLVVVLVLVLIAGITGYFYFSEKYKVYDNGKVSYVKVELGQRLGDAYELLGGIPDGATVVIAGQGRLADGMEVRVEK